jgi:glycosyltransferase involved in cell wall biosynthesis
MRIALDARTLFAAQRRGTGRNLTDAYRIIPQLRPAWEFVLYHQAPPARDPLPPTDNVKRRRMDIIGDRWHAWQEVALPVRAWRDRATLLHCPANEGPNRCMVPLVVTIHDLVPLKVPGELLPDETARFAAKVEAAAHRAAAIICVSEATRRDLLERHPSCADRVHVVPWAADTLCTSGRAHAKPEHDAGRCDEAVLKEVRALYGLAGRRWLISFSGDSPRKNARRLIDAFAAVRQDVRGDTLLVLVGCEPAAFRTELLARALSRRVSDACRIIGFVPESHVPVLLKHASGLVFASLYEGFGLPILDAFASQTPVLTSDVSSMPEIAGDAAVYCKPDDTASITAGMTRLLDDGPSISRLIDRGRERLRAYSWERTAELMCNVYEAAAS